MAAPRTPAPSEEKIPEPTEPSYEELVALLEQEKRARVIAELEAERARTAAAQAVQAAEEAKEQAVREAEDVRQRAVEVMQQPGGLLQGIDNKVLMIGSNLMDDMHLVVNVTRALSTSGLMYQDHRQVKSVGPDGMDRLRWQGYERPLTPPDILSIREEPDADGYVVITGDGKKYRNVVL